MAIWDVVEKEFNANSNLPRIGATLKNKYANLKKRTQTKLAKQRQEVLATDGGSAVPMLFDSVEALIAEIIGEKRLGVTPSTYDDDRSNEFIGFLFNNSCRYMI